MAIMMIPVESSLRLVVIVGTSDQGDPIYKTRIYNRIKPEVDAQEVFDVGQALAELQEYPLNNIQIVVSSKLSEV